MLTTDQKETILRKAGIAVPSTPLGAIQQQQADAAPIAQPSMQADGQTDVKEHWARTIDVLFAEYSAARAARSLCDAKLVQTDAFGQTRFSAS